MEYCYRCKQAFERDDLVTPVRKVGQPDSPTMVRRVGYAHLECPGMAFVVLGPKGQAVLDVLWELGDVDDYTLVDCYNLERGSDCELDKAIYAYLDARRATK